MTISPFDMEFLRRLRRLKIRAPKLGQSSSKGERRSSATGSSLEFAEYREYLPGDDHRFVDWKAFARLDRLFVRLFHDEAALRLHLLIDNSASMGFGGNPTKFEIARRIAVGLSAIGLAGLDVVAVAPLYAGNRGHLRRGRGALAATIADLESMNVSSGEAPGDLALRHALRKFTGRPGRREMVLVLSDFLDPEGYEEGLLLLRHRGYHVGMIQILAREEIDPRFAGDFALADSETGAEIEVTASPRLFDCYRRELGHFLSGLDRFATRHRFPSARVIADADLDRVWFSELRSIVSSDGNKLRV